MFNNRMPCFVLSLLLVSFRFAKLLLPPPLPNPGGRKMEDKSQEINIVLTQLQQPLPIYRQQRAVNNFKLLLAYVQVYELLSGVIVKF